MIRSMYSAITALGLHQTYMDVVANNLANVNTTAYKTSRVDFKAQISQLLSAGNAPTAATVTPSLGGRNAVQVGLGVQLGAITKVMTQGALRSTGRVTDLAVQGDGFFVLDDGTQGHAYTRDGAIDVGQDGKLSQINSALHVLGWQVSPTTGLIDTTGPLTAITVPTNSSLARATANLTLNGNLDATTAAAGTVASTLAVFDSLGTQHNVTLTFTRNAGMSWALTATEADADITALALGGDTTANFLATGQWDTANTATTLTLTLGNGATTPQAVTVDLSKLTMLDEASTAAQASQDGLAAGTLTGLSVVSDSGRVVGLYSNGMTQDIGQVALASFVNPNGLLSAGQNLLRPWLNSGDPQIGTPGSGARGAIASGYLEGSNVDLAQEFTNMITAQRGFQANSRVITTSDEMLQELISMKR